MKAERIGLKRIGLQKIGLPRIGVMGAGASMRPTEIVGISYAREIGANPSAMGNGLLTSEKWAKVSGIKGNSVVDGEQILSYQQWGEKVVWNQLTKTSTITKFNYTGTIRAYWGIILPKVLPINHKLLITCKGTLTAVDGIPNIQYLIYVGSAAGTFNQQSTKFNNGTSAHFFVTPNADTRKVVGVRYFGTPVEGDTLLVENMFVYDLTLMFGEGNEPTTIEEFERRRPRNVSNEYNEGTEINGDIEIKSVGLNALNVEDREEVVTAINLSPTSKREINPNQYWSGVADNGYTSSKACEDVSITSSRISFRQRIGYYGIAFPMDLIPEQNYRITYSAKTSTLRVSTSYFDKNGAHVGTSYANNFTIPKDTKAVLYLTGDAATTYEIENLCIHLVQDGIVSQYKPYTSTTTPLPNVSLIKDADGNQLFPYGLCSAGSVYDEITETKAIKRVGVVDMGTLDWTYRATLTNKPFQTISLKDLVAESSQINFICAKYKSALSISGGSVVGNKYLYRIQVDSGPNNHIILIKDDDYTSADSFKQAMQGVLLYYELAEPIEVDIDKWKAEYKVEQGGTEQIVSANDTTNLKTDIIYGNKM